MKCESEKEKIESEPVILLDLVMDDGLKYQQRCSVDKNKVHPL